MKKTKKVHRPGADLKKWHRLPLKLIIIKFQGSKTLFLQEHGKSLNVAPMKALEISPSSYFDQLHHQKELSSCFHLFHQHNDVWVFHSAQDWDFILDEVFLPNKGLREVDQKPRNPLRYPREQHRLKIWYWRKHFPWYRDTPNPCLVGFHRDRTS